MKHSDLMPPFPGGMFTERHGKGLHTNIPVVLCAGDCDASMPLLGEDQGDQQQLASGEGILADPAPAPGVVGQVLVMDGNNRIERVPCMQRSKSVQQSQFQNKCDVHSTA